MEIELRKGSVSMNKCVELVQAEIMHHVEQSEKVEELIRNSVLNCMMDDKQWMVKYILLKKYFSFNVFFFAYHKFFICFFILIIQDTIHNFYIFTYFVICE